MHGLCEEMRAGLRECANGPWVVLSEGISVEKEDFDYQTQLIHSGLIRWDACLVSVGIPTRICTGDLVTVGCFSFESTVFSWP